ncbi:MAG: ATP-binding cassette domain-containing protein [Coriobacteriia bacterium]|nr:ATP-binding cassette domain-containing protein [Coriobacteriia bacterium]
MLLEVRDVGKTYQTREGAFTALEGVSLEVGQGDTVGLIGTSGSGKSTFASILAGLETADSGTIAFCGAIWDASVRPSRRQGAYRDAVRNLQMVFQNAPASFSERMRVGQGIAEGIAYRSEVPAREHGWRVDEALEMVGLPTSYAHRYPWELSGGECQRAAIARAIISRPRLLICDEPTSALDVTVQAQVVHLLADLCSEMDMACLFISHDLALVRGLCRWVYVLDSGRIVERGPAALLFNDPQAEATKRLVASVAAI